MDTITVEVCFGTSCYLLGASKFVDFDETLPPELAGCVEVRARTCMDLCERDNIGKAPYVRINGTEVICEATPENVRARLLELVKGE